jgi:hypothetical protein
MSFMVDVFFSFDFFGAFMPSNNFNMALAVYLLALLFSPSFDSLAM